MPKRRSLKIELEPLSVTQVLELNPVQLLKYARHRGVVLSVLPCGGVHISPTKPISQWLRDALRHYATDIHRLLQEENDDWRLWKLFKLTPEHRQAVRELARAADRSCEEVMTLIYRVACELAQTDLVRCAIGVEKLGEGG